MSGPLSYRSGRAGQWPLLPVRTVPYLCSVYAQVLAYKHHLTTSCMFVYLLHWDEYRNFAYVGFTDTPPSRRLYAHMNAAIRDDCVSTPLQVFMNKVGVFNTNMTVLEVADNRSHGEEREQYWMRVMAQIGATVLNVQYNLLRKKDILARITAALGDRTPFCSRVGRISKSGKNRCIFSYPPIYTLYYKNYQFMKLGEAMPHPVKMNPNSNLNENTCACNKSACHLLPPLDTSNSFVRSVLKHSPGAAYDIAST
jgi:hypothetical protein